MMGIISSMHCVGMCGPLIIAMPLEARNLFGRTKNGLLYHAGRITTYAVAGGVAGFLGFTFFAGVAQRHLSVIMGCLMLFYVLLVWLGKKTGNKWSSFANNLFWSFRQRFSRLKLFRNNRSAFLFGLLNGLLPCGVVYLALSSSVATGSVSRGVLFMIFFGLGTTPALFSVGVAGASFRIKWKYLFQKTVPAMLSILALLLILRGMNLGVPFLSPQLTETKKACCAKPE